MSKAQMDSLYTNAAAAIVGARASAQNAATNAKVGASQAYNLDTESFVKGQQNLRDSRLFNVTLKSLRLGAQENQMKFDYWHNSGKFNDFMWHSGNMLEHINPNKFGFK
jgi:hypothetical protein